MRTQEEELVRANQAREVLDNPLYQDAFNSLAADIERQWKASPARDTEGREQLWMMQKLLERIEGHLRDTMLTGKMATEQLRVKESIAERARRFVG